MIEPLTRQQIDQFIHSGFVRIEGAFPKSIAEQVREILWNDTGLNKHDRSTWTKAVVRLGMYSQEPFIQAANTRKLHQAFDQLIGKNRWIPCNSMGTFPIRFPSKEDPGDTGWHVDASFPGHDPADYFNWRINIKSKGRALLMLFLFSDVDRFDAPTKIKVGSHLNVARVLSEAGDAGFTFMELAERLTSLPDSETALATGEAGTVYLCHPFIVHAAQPHHGQEPRFMAQPPLILRDEAILDQPKYSYTPL
jgi:hypothetical protein